MYSLTSGKSDTCVLPLAGPYTLLSWRSKAVVVGSMTRLDTPSSLFFFLDDLDVEDKLLPSSAVSATD